MVMFPSTGDEGALEPPTCACSDPVGLDIAYPNKPARLNTQGIPRCGIWLVVPLIEKLEKLVTKTHASRASLARSD